MLDLFRKQISIKDLLLKHIYLKHIFRILYTAVFCLGSAFAKEYGAVAQEISSNLTESIFKFSPKK